MRGRRKSFWWRWLWLGFGALAVLTVALVALTPTLLVSLPYPTLTFDLSRFLNAKTASLVTNKTATLNFALRRVPGGTYDLRARGVLLDWPFSMQANLRPTFRFLGVDVSGEVDARLNGTPWSLQVDFDASSSGEWRAAVDVPETPFSESDPVVGPVLSRWPMPAISNLVFGGTFGMKVEAARTNGAPVAKWSATGRLKDMDIACNVGKMPVNISNLRMGFGASGISNHADIRPMFPHADKIMLGGCMLTNAFASIRATESAYLVTEAGAGCCGGELKLYSFFLDPKKLNAGVTLFVDGVEAGEALRLLKGFNGEASGRLYGKIPLKLRDGEELQLRNAYLHSMPGETGSLKMFDPQPVVESLALGGVPEATRANVAKALADLSYTVLKIGLQPEDGGGMALTVKLSGSATHRNVTVPVSFEVTFHGDIEQLINTGLKTVRTAKMKK